jgi:hypothetical protein
MLHSTKTLRSPRRQDAPNAQSLPLISRAAGCVRSHSRDYRLREARELRLLGGREPNDVKSLGLCRPQPAGLMQPVPDLCLVAGDFEW